MNMLGKSSIWVLSGLASLSLAATSAADEVPETPAVGVSAIESNLRVGVAKIDITPPPGTKVVGHVRETNGVRDPIRAAILLLDDGRTKAAIVTFDFISSWEELVREVRDAVSQSTGRPGRISWSPVRTIIPARNGRKTRHTVGR